MDIYVCEIILSYTHNHHLYARVSKLWHAASRMLESFDDIMYDRNLAIQLASQDRWHLILQMSNVGLHIDEIIDMAFEHNKPAIAAAVAKIHMPSNPYSVLYLSWHMDLHSKKIYTKNLLLDLQDNYIFATYDQLVGRVHPQMAAWIQQQKWFKKIPKYARLIILGFYYPRLHREHISIDHDNTFPSTHYFTRPQPLILSRVRGQLQRVSAFDTSIF